MRDHLLDLVEHTLKLGVIDLVKITGDDKSTVINGIAEDRSVVVEGAFTAPVADFIGNFGMPNLTKLNILLNLTEYQKDAKLTITRRDTGAPDGINFENATGDFKNNYRFMASEIVNEKLKTDTSLTDEQKQQIGSEIVDAQDLIDDIRENPEGDYDEDQIEEAIYNWAEENEDNFIQLIKDVGMDLKDIVYYVDTKGIIDTVMGEDGYGTILGSYDGDYEEIDVENETYIVFRYN